MTEPTKAPPTAIITQEKSEDAVKMYMGQASTLILIIGKSGRGKSTALRSLNPDSTYIINVMGKPLPFPRASLYTTSKNMTITADPSQIRQTMLKVSRERKEIHNLVIDDAQYIMATEFMNKALEKGYDKFSLMARNFWEIMILASKLKPDLKVYILCHEEETDRERKMKTLGKMLDDKITPEGLSSIVLYSDVTGDATNRRYFFTTQSDGLTNAKTPYDMFPYRIPNDLALVGKRIDEYYSGVELKNSKLKFEV